MQDLFDKYEKEHEEHKYFKGDSEYADLASDLLSVISKANIERFRSLVESSDLRRLPASPGFHYDVQSPPVYDLGAKLWTPLLHMVYHNNASQEQQIAMIKEVISLGFHLRQAVKLEATEDSNSRGPAMFSAILFIALEKKSY